MSEYLARCPSLGVRATGSFVEGLRQRRIDRDRSNMISFVDLGSARHASMPLGLGAERGRSVGERVAHALVTFVTPRHPALVEVDFRRDEVSASGRYPYAVTTRSGQIAPEVDANPSTRIDVGFAVLRP